MKDGVEGIFCMLVTGPHVYIATEKFERMELVDLLV